LFQSGSLFHEHLDLKWLTFILAFTSSQVSAYDGLKKELQHVSKKVLIVYEDVERVKNPEVVKKIFAVGERLAGPRVKIIYEYDGKELDDQELTRKYREKYIPIEMNLTGISYRNLVVSIPAA